MLIASKLSFIEYKTGVSQDLILLYLKVLENRKIINRITIGVKTEFTHMFHVNGNDVWLLTIPSLYHCILPGHAWQCASVQWQRSGSGHISCRKTGFQCLLSWWPSILWTGYDAGHWWPWRLSPQQRTRWRGWFEDFLPRVHCGPRTLPPPGMHRETVIWYNKVIHVDCTISI